MRDPLYWYKHRTKVGLAGGGVVIVGIFIFFIISALLKPKDETYTPDTTSSTGKIYYRCGTSKTTHQDRYCTYLSKCTHEVLGTTDHSKPCKKCG